MTTPLLRVEKLNCERDDRILISDLDLSLHRGDVMQVEGPNGSGKTTLLRVLCGLSDDYEGSIYWQDQPIRQLAIEFRQHTLYFGHLTGVKLALSATENLHWMLSLKGLQLRGSEGDEALQQALEQVGLLGYEDVPVSMLSAGQKRRVALARLHLEPAKLWVLDEPFTAIDKQGVAALEELIGRQANRGGAVLITSHHALEMAGIRHLQLGLRGGQWRI